MQQPHRQTASTKRRAEITKKRKEKTTTKTTSQSEEPAKTKAQEKNETETSAAATEAGTKKQESSAGEITEASGMTEGWIRGGSKSYENTGTESGESTKTGRF